MASSGARPPPPDPEFLPGRVCTSSTDAQRCAGIDLPTLHRRIRRQGWRRPGATRPTGLDLWSWTRPGRGPYATFVAGRRRTESHPFTKRANMCAEHAGHWMPAVSPLLIDGGENWFRRQPYSRVRKPHIAAISAALTPHIVQEPCHRVDHPPRSHRRRVPTRTTLPTHLRSVDSSARSFASFRSVRHRPTPLDSRNPERWVMRGAW